MNNFFLLNEAMNTPTILAFENGVIQLNNILNIRNNNNQFLRDEYFWEYQTTHGKMIDFTFSILKAELRYLMIKVFESFSISPLYFLNKEDLDTAYPNDCNGFVGFDFSQTTISSILQIVDETSFSAFVNNCAVTRAYNSIEDFWNHRALLFPNLVFCETVLGQIQHLSVGDDRFKLIDQKLKILDRFTGLWTEGAFQYKNLGLDNSPDTPTRVRSTLHLRTFNCPNIGNQVFNLHIKWYCGSEPFRLYYYPSNVDYKVYVGYIGAKSEIGF